MTNGPRFGYEDTLSYTTEKPGRNWTKSCFVGCLWTLAIVAVVGAIGGYFMMPRLRNWASDTAAQAAKQSIEAIDLPKAEKDELGVQVDRVAEAFRQGKLSAEQVRMIGKLLIESPLATSLAVAVVDSKYFERSGLSDAEKLAGRRTLRRFARGAIDGKIPAEDRDAALARIADRQQDGNWRLRDRVSDDDLRDMLNAAQVAADAAAIEAEPEVVDPSEELRRIIDESLEHGTNP